MSTFSSCCGLKRILTRAYGNASRQRSPANLGGTRADLAPRRSAAPVSDVVGGRQVLGRAPSGPRRKSVRVVRRRRRRRQRRQLVQVETCQGLEYRPRATAGADVCKSTGLAGEAEGGAPNAENGALRRALAREQALIASQATEHEAAVRSHQRHICSYQRRSQQNVPREPSTCQLPTVRASCSTSFADHLCVTLGVLGARA
mmetsp:Transcript_10782/g.31804  ORF Transcript_10782/g.31804 Transcript_10782/m.31804 type:complete len:202 (-) Transcript_10782:177-782(-)